MKTIDLIKNYYNQFNKIIIKDVGYTYQAGTLKNCTSSIYEETNLFLARRAGVRDKMRMIDAGCGSGGPACTIANFYSEVQIDAITISEEQVSTGNKLIKEKKLEKRINMYVGDYHELPFKKDSYDLIYFFESVGYSYNLEQLFKEAYRILKPRGIIYIKDVFLIEKKITRLEKEALKIFNNIYVQDTKTIEELKREMSKCGFNKIEYCNLCEYIDTEQVQSTMIMQRNGNYLITKKGDPVLTNFGKRHYDPIVGHAPVYFGEIKAFKS